MFSNNAKHNAFSSLVLNLLGVTQGFAVNCAQSQPLSALELGILDGGYLAPYLAAPEVDKLLFEVLVFHTDVAAVHWSMFDSALQM